MTRFLFGYPLTKHNSTFAFQHRDFVLEEAYFVKLALRTVCSSLSEHPGDCSDGSDGSQCTADNGDLSFHTIVNLTRNN
jgi:hypothetical protein